MASSSGEQPWTLGRLLDWTTRFLSEKRSESPRLDAEVLLAHACGCRRIELYTRYDEPATDEVRSRYRELVRKRVEGCPVAYLVGRKEFFSLEFEVGPAVLIPRPDTETLVMACLELAKPLAMPAVLDVGVGAGNIAVAVAKQHAGAQLTAIDISAEALAVAQRNAARHGVGSRMRFLQGDLFAPLAPGDGFDFIVSNPPYIAQEDWDSLPAGVRQYEPKTALDGGPGGYRFVERLINEAPRHLKPDGWLILEIGTSQEAAVRRLIEARPRFQLALTIRDYSGHPRVARAQWKG